MENLAVISGLLVFCFVGAIGLAYNQWRLNRKRVVPVPVNRITIATISHDEKASFREWNGL